VPESVRDLSFAISALNVCTGGTQIINVFGGTGQVPGFRPLLDDWQAGTTQGISQGGRWCVTWTYGDAGTLVLFRAVFTTLVSGTRIFARVYDGLNGSSSEEYIDGDSRYVPGDETTMGPASIWTWDRALTGVTFSDIGVEHHVRLFKVYNGVGQRDESLAFLAVPCIGSGSSGNPALAPQSFLAFARALELNVADGQHAGRHFLEQVGRLVWRVTAGPLKGLIEFTAAADTLSVRTPAGRQDAAIVRTRPFSVVFSGDLFGSSHDVVVCAP
jgi:hypothetical protein